MWRMSGEAVRAMAPASSAVTASMTSQAPWGPFSWMGPMTGRPTDTAVAPRARHLKASVPFITPQSTKIGMRPPMTRAISGRTISGGTAVGRMPWWCETTMPCTPASRHLRASTALSTPLMMKGSLVRLT